jgi:hypothetical protein
VAPEKRVRESENVLLHIGANDFFWQTHGAERKTRSYHETQTMGQCGLTQRYRKRQHI